MRTQMNGKENIVQIDLNVIFTIIQNLNDIPERDINSTTGALVGFQTDSKLEITNSFQFPKTNLQNYNQDICKIYNNLKFESNIVGLYTAALYDSFMSEDFLMKLYLYQSSISECVVIVFDYAKFSIGIPSIKAYKLTERALCLLRSNNFSSNNISSNLYSFDNLLCEIHITSRISPLTRLLVEKMSIIQKFESRKQQNNDENLLDKRIYYLNRSMKDMAQEIYKLTLKSKKIQNLYSSADQMKDKYDSIDQMSNINTETSNLSLDYLGMIITCWNTNYLTEEVNNFVNYIQSQPEILSSLNPK